ncbi:hypothetical protein [Lysobacter humi (ex Lee et al. 2017)]
MPLLLPVLLLLAVLLLALPLWAFGVVGRLRRPPRPRRAMPWQLTLQGLVLAFGVSAYGAVAWTWRPDMGPAIAGGLLAGALAGAGSAASARLERRGEAWYQTPNRLFFLLLAMLVLARIGWSAYGVLADLQPSQAPLLAGLAAMLAGYPLAQAWWLRARLRRAMRLR